MSKAIWKSKTFWANVVAVLATVGGFFNFDVSPEQQASIVAGIFTIVNITMRLVSSGKVSALGSTGGGPPPKGNGGG